MVATRAVQVLDENAAALVVGKAKAVEVDATVFGTDVAVPAKLI